MRMFGRPQMLVEGPQVDMNPSDLGEGNTDSSITPAVRSLRRLEW